MSSRNETSDNTGEDSKSKLEKSVVCSLAVLSLIGLIDAISYMAVAPSLIFYVNSLGGTKEQYGVIMSCFSLASFLFKPVYGSWVDRSGNKYKLPYIASFSAAIFGNLLYFAAILLPTSAAEGTNYNMGVLGLLIGRFFAGMGAANNALGFSYIATVIPHDRQTTINVLLSMVRIVGMTAGPFVNLLLSEIDSEITLGGISIPLNPYNSVGLFVALGQLVVLTVSLIFFTEPPTPSKEDKTDDEVPKAGMREFWEAVTCIEIVVPMFIIFVINCNFQL